MKSKNKSFCLHRNNSIKQDGFQVTNMIVFNWFDWLKKKEVEGEQLFWIITSLCLITSSVHFTAVE